MYSLMRDKWADRVSEQLELFTMDKGHVRTWGECKAEKRQVMRERERSKQLACTGRYRQVTRERERERERERFKLG